MITYYLISIYTINRVSFQLFNQAQNSKYAALKLFLFMGGANNFLHYIRNNDFSTLSKKFLNSICVESLLRNIHLVIITRQEILKFLNDDFKSNQEKTNKINNYLE